MSKINRKIEYKLYPNKTQQAQLEEMLTLHRNLYNGALEERIEAYKLLKKLDLDKETEHTKIEELQINFASQCKELTQLRKDCEEYRELNAQSEQLTLKRLDEAFQHFFRRVSEQKEKPGFPRFKSKNRYKSFGYKSHLDGWKFEAGTDFIHGILKLSGVGFIQARGRGRFMDEAKTSRNHGTPKTLQLKKKGKEWYASITFEMPVLPFRASGEDQIGMDWGLENFLTIVNQEKAVQTHSNPRFLKKALKKLTKSQKKLSRKKKGSKGREKAKKKVVQIHRKIAHKRKNELHQVSTKLIEKASFVATEKLNIKAMTANGGAYKKGLNRSILDSSPGLFLQLVEYKAEEAGVPFIQINTRKVKPSQRCFHCDLFEKKELSERTHHCKKCSFTIHRDVNAALVILKYARLHQDAGREPAFGVEKEKIPSMKHETPTRTQLAEFGGM